MTIEQHASKLLAIFPECVRGDLILGGGCLRAFYDGTPIKDIDVWFRNRQAFADTVFELEFHPRWTRLPSPRGCYNFRAPSGELVNLIGFHFGEAIEIVRRFDFRCCGMVAVQNYEFGAAVAQLPYAVDDATERLIYVLNNNGTERTVRRIAHYVEDYGYSLHPVQDDESEPDGHQPQGVHEQPPVVPEPAYIAKARRRIGRLPVSRFDYPDDQP